MFIPAGFSIIWFAIYGTLGMKCDLEVIKQAVQSTSTALFLVLKEYPLGMVISVIMFVLICTFFITSANSATYVLGMYSEKGTLDPTNKTKIVWGVLMAALAAAMMLGSGNGLSMLQTLSIVAAFPFAFIMVAAMVALVKALKKEREEQ